MKRTFVIYCLAVGIFVLTITDVAFADRPGRLLAANNNDCRSIPTCDENDPLHLKGIFLELDPSTGTGTQIGVISHSAPSLAFSERTGQLYGSMTVLNLPIPAESQLNLVDPETAATTFIGVIRNAMDEAIEYGVAAMAFSADGSLYGIDRRSSSLLLIDPSTALAMPVGSGLGFPVKGNGGTIDDGVFYLLSGTRNFEVELYTVDLTTGLAYPVGGTGVQDSGIGLTVGPSGELLGVINDKLYGIDPFSGAATVIGDIGVPLVSSLEFIDEIALQCPCDNRAGGGNWRNQGEYVSCVAGVANHLKKAGMISGSEKGDIVSEAAQSECGT